MKELKKVARKYVVPQQPIPAQDIKEICNTDVVVVGAGTSGKAAIDPNARRIGGTTPDIPDRRFEYRYPAGYTFPFHYKHAVTGKETTEGIRNASVKGMKGYKIHP